MRALRLLLLTISFSSQCVAVLPGQAPVSPDSDSIEFVQHAPSSAEGAEALEAALKANPHDRVAHIRLMGYYWSQTTLYNRPDTRRSLLEEANSFAIHEPQSVVFEQSDFNLKLSDFAPPHADDWTRYEASWMDGVKRYPDNTAVLQHALRALQAVDLDVPFFCERRLRALMPTDPRFAVGLSGLYIRVIEIQLKRNSGVSSAFTQLMGSGDAAGMGLTGQAVVASSKLIGKPDLMDALGPQLLKKAHELDPANARWSDALNAPAPASMDEIVMAVNTVKQEDLWPGGKVTGMMVPATALRVDAAAQAAKLIAPNAAFLKYALGSQPVPSEVSLLALIGPDGHVLQTQFDFGSVRLFSQAMGMVRSWRYTPGMADGHAVPVVTKIDLKFTAPSPSPTAGVAGMAGMGAPGGVMGGIAGGATVADPVLATASPNTIKVPPDVLASLALSNPPIPSPAGAKGYANVVLKMISPCGRNDAVKSPYVCNCCNH